MQATMSRSKFFDTLVQRQKLPSQSRRQLQLKVLVNIAYPVAPVVTIDHFDNIPRTHSAQKTDVCGEIGDRCRCVFRIVWQINECIRPTKKLLGHLSDRSLSDHHTTGCE